MTKFEHINRDAVLNVLSGWTEYSASHDLYIGVYKPVFSSVAPILLNKYYGYYEKILSLTNWKEV